MADNTTSTRLITPVMEACRDTIVALGFCSELEFRFGEMIERDGQSGGAVRISSAIPPILNQVTERPNGGRFPSVTWRDAQGRRYTRHLRSNLIMHFDLNIFSGSLSKTVDGLLDFVAALPGDVNDAHRFKDYDDAATEAANRVPVLSQGNVATLTCISPILPEVRTSTARLYKASLIVRVQSGVYHDLIDGIPVSVKIGQPSIR